MMDDRQFAFFKVLLSDQLDRLLIQADLVQSELAFQDGQEIESLDRASAQAEQTMRLRIRNRESRLIKKLRQALERIEDQTYGICEECEEDISIKRLEVRPVTSKCIECKELEELQELLSQ